MHDFPADHAAFPLWIELSGLPAHLNQLAKAPFAWSVFHKVIELDMGLHKVRPGIIEIPPKELAARCGLDAAKVEKALKGMRKAGIARAFWPENEEEPALFQIITPLPTPQSPDEIRAAHPDLFLEADWPPRYAVEMPEDGDEGDAEKSREEKIKRVVELYLNTFSMKMNSLILDQLMVITKRYDQQLIEKVFQRAKDKDARSLSWILTEIRRELKFQQRAIGGDDAGSQVG